MTLDNLTPRRDIPPCVIFSLLSNHTRYSIIQLLHSRVQMHPTTWTPTQTIAEKLGIRPSVCSTHLQKLSHYGLIKNRPRGAYSLWILDKDAERKITDAVNTLFQEGDHT